MLLSGLFSLYVSITSQHFCSAFNKSLGEAFAPLPATLTANKHSPDCLLTAQFTPISACYVSIQCIFVLLSLQLRRKYGPGTSSPRYGTEKAFLWQAVKALQQPGLPVMLSTNETHELL